MTKATSRLNIVEDAGRHEGHEIGLSRCDLFRQSEDFLIRQGEGQGRILDQGDDLVGHRRQDVLDHLGKHDAHEGLGFGVPQHLGRFILSLGNGLDPAPVDLCEIRRIVQGEPENDRYEAVSADIGAPQIERCEIHHQQLEHQRRSPQHGNVDPGDIFDDRVFGHPGKGHQHPEGHRED